MIYPLCNLQRESKNIGNDDTSAEDQKSVNVVSSFNECTKESEVKTLLQATVGIL